MTKADFIRKHPGVKAAEIVEKAKKAKLGITVANVYQCRAYDNRMSRTKGRKYVQKPNRTKTRALLAQAETLLVAVASELGLARAIEVLQTDRARVQKLLG